MFVGGEIFQSSYIMWIPWFFIELEVSVIVQQWTETRCISWELFKPVHERLTWDVCNISWWVCWTLQWAAEVWVHPTSLLNASFMLKHLLILHRFAFIFLLVVGEKQKKSWAFYTPSQPSWLPPEWGKNCTVSAKWAEDRMI